MVNNSNHVQTGAVYFTNNLEVFKVMGGNRNVNPRHVERISKSIDVVGVLMNPIIVNSDFEVVDGQHRLAACKMSDVGVYYVVADGYSLNEVHALNLNQKNWGTIDYLQGYADMGLTQYKKLRKFMDINNEFSIAIALAICSDVDKAGGRNITFHSGDWKCSDWEKAQDNADKINLLGSIYDGNTRRSFVVAMVGLLDNPNFDFNEFMHKLRLQPSALVDCLNVAAYKVLIEDIYNYRRKDKVSLKY